MNTLKKLRSMALLSGWFFILMALVAGIGFGYAFPKLYVANNSAATFLQFKQSHNLFLVFVACFAVILILDLLLAWTLYHFFKETHKNLSKWMAWTRIVYSIFLAVAILNLPDLLGDSGAAEQVSFAFKSFLFYWQLGLIVFGIHLLLLGILILKSSNIPNWIAVLSLIAAICYFFNNTAIVLVPDYESYKGNIDAILGLPSAMGEMILAFWLLFKGGKTKQTQRA